MLVVQVLAECIEARVPERLELVDPAHHLLQRLRLQAIDARLDRRIYPIGKKVSAKELSELKIERDGFHGDWNYVIKPRKMR